ncbi:MAG: phosphatidylglycerophosphatase A [Betaproteobacteria bacterium]|jgi:phosphatidylglycerophosphatase A|nr:phosphatidylglycerophosphatase A [Rhodocyclaceae bacterium]MCA3133010.1 phosphatidylglycerophosphatase A [Rhodocyclaceae bacterium]MCA3141911.1 phosphatidylglycerophosphatase A [Rhodocyclaceae bacterium]MCA3144819.1 phosphatidylglycerophosphatase A [Rhodocyclaceae bacterium]
MGTAPPWLWKRAALTTSPDETRPQPGLRFLLAHPAHAIAFGFGAGLVRPAPGTAGTLLALPIFWFVYPRLPDGIFLLLLGVLLALGTWACGRTGRALGVHDHGGMVIDEIVAFLLVLFMLPREPLWEAFGFLLFRLFDILKPLPIRYYDRTMKTGFGVMFDDLIAALYTLLVLALWKVAAL